MTWGIQHPLPLSIQQRLLQLHRDIDQLQAQIEQGSEHQSMKPEQSLEIESLNAKVTQTPIAIIGMASLFPQAKNLQEYWNNIVQKTDCITDVPASRWNIDDYYDPDPTAPDKTYCKRGGFIPDIDFNPMEFGLPPNILEVTDIAQILSLIVAKQALKDAGYDQAAEAVRDRIGVILGVGGGQKLITPLTARLQSPILEKVLTSSGLSPEETEKIIEKVKLAYIGWEENSFPGMLGNVIAGRIANRLDLGGINCVVDAACAGSLSALQMALDQLTSRRCDMMITGGVDADNSPFMYLSFSKTPAFSKQEQMRPFDAESDGMIIGEGIGMMVLKRLANAERDGDHIYAVIKGMGASSDGKYKSIYAPRPSGQAKALRRAYENADCDPSSVGLIEAHGTGTAAGDPAEFAALQEVFSEAKTDVQAIALGSVKSQIGHTKAAAGAASLIKAVLALHHKILPPTLNVTQPNPKFQIEQSPFYLNTEPRPWIRTEADPPRRAGVSSFGFGGTNFHVVLEEYTGKQPQGYRLHQVPAILLFAAANPAELLAQCETVLVRWQSDAAEQHYQECAIASRSIEIPTISARLGFVAASLSEACKLLQTAIQALKHQMTADSWQHPQGICYRKMGMDTTGKLVALFPGQGSQYLNMGQELALNFPTIRQSFAAMDSLFQRDQLSPVSEIVYPRPVFTTAQQQQQTATLQKTEHAQPVIGAFSMGLYKLLQQAGFRADFYAGHSFGEVTALWAAGVLSNEDYCFLVKARGQALATPAHPNFDAGAMLAITGDLDTIQNVVKNFPNVIIANWNSKQQVVLAGATPEIANVEHRFMEFGCSVTRLPVSAAFHTPLVSHAYQQFAQALRVVNFNRPTVPIYSNVTAEPYPQNATEIGQTLASQLLNPVCFKQEIEQIYAAGGRIFVEIGPRSVLTHLTQNILEGQPHLAIALNPSRNGDSDRQFRTAVMQLQVAGLPLKDFDPYGLELKPAVPTHKNGMTVRVNGSNYVSEKTRTAFEQALQDGYQISRQSLAQPVTPSVVRPAVAVPIREQQVVEPQIELHLVPSVRSLGEESQVTSSQSQINVTQFIAPMLQIVSEKTGYPAEMLSLSMDMEADLGIDSIKRVEILGAMQDQFPELPPMQPEILSELRTLEQIVDYLGQQKVNCENSDSPAIAPVNEAVSSISTPSISNSPSTVSVDPQKTSFDSSLMQTLLAIVSEKTGYPVQLLSLEMDMEADLGIDSIKRVEILGAMQDQFGSLPSVEPEALAELHTLGQIVQHLGQQPEIAPMMGATEAQSVAVETSVPVLSVQPLVAQPISAPPIASATTAPELIANPASALESSQLISALLTIVSEKTGYPSEMLSLEMDMEADLGIDSIKRVEILGAMQDQFPDLPAANPETLAEMRTLAQIVEYMGQSQVAESHPASSSAPVAFAAPTMPVTIPAIVPEPFEVAASAIALNQLIADLLNIVSEKTGYPAAMLNLGMDMEADLGIDSIKRVEILGAVQDAFPDLPAVDSEALAEMRTLEQIVQYMGQQATTTGKKKVIVSEAPSVVKLPEETLIQRGQATLTPLPPPDWLDFSLPVQSVCLVTDDGSPLTVQLVQKLTTQGWQVVVLSFPETLVAQPQPSTLPLPRIVLKDLSEAHLKQQLDAITQQYGSIAIFIHLQPRFETSPIAATPEHSQIMLHHPAATATLKHLFFIAKYLKRSLMEAAQYHRSCFLTVTRLDGEFGLKSASLNSADMLSGGLFGLTKTVNLEWSQVFCRAIDIAPDCSVTTAAQQIVQELHDPDRLIAEVGYGAAGRVTLTCGQAIELASTRPVTSDHHPVFLVSGGGKGITAQCITHLARYTQCKFILLGRSELIAEPTWAEGVEPALELKQRAISALMAENPKTTPAQIQKAVNAVLSHREITATLQAIQQAGGEAEYLSADLTQVTDLRPRLDTIVQRFGPITGIIHGAGTLADKLIENKSERDFDRVYTTKIVGLNTLLNSVDYNQLNHLVLFSSAAGFYGNIGQSDYAIANEILNKFAHQFKRQHPDCHVVSFNWGPWDSGMVTPEVKQIFAQRKIEVIPTEIGTQVFAYQLLQGNPETVQVLVGSPLAVLAATTDGKPKTYHIRRRLSLAENPFLNDHTLGQQVVLPMVCSAAWVANTCEQLYPGYRFFRCGQHKVFKGIVFDQSLASEYILNVEEVNTNQSGEIQLKTMIWSQLPNGQPRYHYSTDITLVQTLPPPPRYESFDLTPDPAIVKLAPYQNGTLFHGASFQGIQRVLNLTPQRLTLECVLPAVSFDQRQQFSDHALDAIAHDMSYQGILIWVRQFHQAGSLPLSCQKSEQFEAVPIGQPFYVSIEIVSSTATKLVANAVTHDAEGKIYSQIFGAEVTISRQLNRLFGMLDKNSAGFTLHSIPDYSASVLQGEKS
ncbi:MAG: SDR family NAD(P)-dependent oxidoreductase [Phormidium tanganyikae FI6-MK23]|jgi:acyl transferase domain-containing protein|nr:SDR family NAD(P)-dependent oxidoreductase [Phormidium tanganyikae FI6-MK23]